MKNQIMTMIGCVAALMFGFTAGARTFDFKQLKSTGSKGSAEYWWQGTEKSKSSWLQIKVGSASKIDDTSPMEIRAATVLKSVKDRKSGINDVAKFEFDPINRGPAIFFMVATGAAFSREHDSYYYGNVNTGWQLAGCIIEIWQKGKVVKHWSNVTGKDGKTKLTDNIKELRINRDGRPCAGDRFYESRSFDNATEIYSVDKDGERVDIDDVLKPFREAGSGASKDDGVPAAKTLVKNAVAPKLQSCDFLLNGRFKKNAKVYLCLFSASWCPPCRAEMPRIAKTYAETLKDDPDIELIHFSRDQNDEKAMAWAKEHDVKFPVVKPNGGNPLNLHTRGIPHLFIVKADGTLIEEGHPMRLFNEEKFRELKGGGATDGVKHQDGRTCSSATEGVTNVTTEGGLFTLTGPYGIRMTADPGCEKGAEYVMKKLVEVYLPRAKEFYGDPFLGEKPSRTYRIDVDQNDGLGNSTYTGPSYSPRTGSWSIGLSKGADRYEMSLDYLASSVLTLCEEPKWASFVFYVNRFVEAKAKGIDAAPRLKEDIRRGLEEDDEDGKDNWYRSHAPLWAALEDLRTKHPKLILDYCALKNKRFSEGKLPKKLSLDQMAALLSEVSGENASELFNKYGVKDSNAKKAGCGGNSPARAKSRDGKDYSKGEMGTAVVDGITWSYSIQDGEATIVPARGHICAISPRPQGDVTIPSKLGGVNVTGIGKSAFAGCESMATVVIPPSVRSIGDYVFYDCRGLTSVTIPTTVTNIGFGAFFRCNGLTSVTIPDGVKSLKDSTFCYCNGLTSVKIPPTLTNMGRGVFSGCRGLADSQGFVIVNGILCAYEGYMPSVTIPAGVTCIGDAFSESKSLKSVTIPSSVKNIRNRAFCGSFWLTSVTMLGERPESPNDVFRACRNLKAIHVPPNAKSWAGMKEWQGIPLVFDAETK